MAFAVIRVRGTEQTDRRVKETLRQLRLNKINHLVFLPQGDTSVGMLNRIKDYVTWGEVSPETIAKLLLRRGEAVGSRSTKGVNDDFIKSNSDKFTSMISFAKAVERSEANLADIRNLQPVIRLHPPIGGYENIKRSFAAGGTLGYRGRAIEKLLERMMTDLDSRG